MESLTFIMQNYLEAIFELSKQTTYARLSDIAERLGVSKASASNAMQTLQSKGLITTERYREIYLTDEGRQLAEIISKKHHTIRRFFIDVLSIDAETADIDACAIEHVISTASISAMERFLSKQK